MTDTAMFEHDDVIAAILALGVRQTEAPNPADMVSRYEAVRKQLHLAREARSRLELEEWDRNAHLRDDDGRAV